MSKHSRTENKKEVEHISVRVKNTKAEIEKLKSDLQKLISTGNQAAVPKFIFDGKPEAERVDTQPKNPLFPKKPPSELQPHVKKSGPEPPPKKPEPASPSKKVKSYNVVEARDYIKKQRERRAEQLKAQINKADGHLDIKKQKLRELHQKSLELVSRNVQMKRERSKSRDKEPPVCIDKSNPRHRSQENRRNIASKSQERQKQTCSRGNSAERTQAKSQDRNKSQETNARIGRSRIREHQKPEALKINPNLLYPPDAKLTRKSGIELEKTIFPSREDTGVAVDSTIENSAKIDLNKAIIQLDDTKEEMKPKTQKKVLEHSIMTDACLKDTKETQTKVRNFDIPWMEPLPAVPYPYNFINTVKRKLQFAINSPRSCVDVGVQNSEGTPQNRAEKSREEIKELLIRSTSSELRSFASHKCPNLDLRTIENLELVPHYESTNNNKVGPQTEGTSRNLFRDYDSESDTSKNIPEISSESLSLEKLKELKVQKLSQSATHSTVKTDDNYSSDFQKESTKTKTVDGDSTVSTKTSERISNNDSQNVKNSINTERRSTGDNLKSFHSLLTEGQASKSQSESIPERFSLKFLGESMSLKEPNVSVSIGNNDVTKSSGNTVIVRESSTDSTKHTSHNNKESSEEILKSSATEDTTSKSTSEVIDTALKNSKSDTISKSLRLKEPTVSLSFRRDQNKIDSAKNITVRPTATAAKNVNEIHLKFEAEVRLLNDFNESFRQFVAVEKAFENLKSQNVAKILQNVDTQTSFVTRTSHSERSPGNDRTSSINFSRGSEIAEELNDSVIGGNNGDDNKRNFSKSLQNSSFSTEWNLSNLDESSNGSLSFAEEGKSKFSVSNLDNCNVKNCAGLLSLNIFDQLIKDEDTRIQQLKAIIKIREQALLDRTKSELVWLEIQKKQLIETGKVEEASLLKKKQRGIILKHEQERNEIKKLKQMQKEASEHRKNTLKQQRNLIKTQLSTEDMLSKIAVKKRRERRSAGPLKVVQSCSESVHSETSISLKSSGIEDVLSITSKSVRISEESELDLANKFGELREEEVPVSNAKRTLLMREAALQKRREAAEELLKWHRKLLDEERKIDELEAAATSVIGRTGRPHRDRYRFDGRQLNQLWRNMTGSDGGKFVDEKVYVMSQVALERLCKSARQYANKNGEEARKSGDEANYSSAFEPESVHEIVGSQEEKTQISSISELIDNFSRIGNEISSLSRKSEEIVSLKEDSDKSVVETVSPRCEEEQKESSGSASVEGNESRVVEVLEEKIEESKLTPDVPTEEIEERETIPEISTEIEKNASEDLDTGLSSLEEALQSASKIEKSLSIFNEKLSSEKKIEESEEISSTKDKSTSLITTETPKQSPNTSNIEVDVEEDKSSSFASVSTKMTEKTEAHEETSNKIIPEEGESCVVTEDDIKTSHTEAEKKSIKENEESLEENSTISSVSQDKTGPLAEEKQSKSIASSTSTETDEKTPQRKSPTNQIDVKKRVSEILADASPSRSDRSPRLQDLYVTAYDVAPPNSSDFPGVFEDGRQLPTDIFGSEAEELWRKQLAIEQEIKQIEEQQKEQIPYMYMREIPNKPPPPYTPPSSLSSPPPSILPSEVKEINEIASYSSKVLYKAYQNSNLEKVKFSENGFKLFSKIEVTKICAEFVFNICRDIAREHYKQFETVEEPPWLVLTKKPQLAKTKPPDAVGLERIFVGRLKELFGFKKRQVAESAIIKWGRKKRDHVDEVLVIESQEEESQWTNFDKDELFVKNQMTNDIMKMLIEETAGVFAKILSKKKFSV